MKIFEILTALNSTSKKKEKISIIRANRGNFEFVSVLKYAYDKLDTNYFVKKVPIGDVSGIADIDDNMDVVCTLLNSLSTRKVTGNDALLAIKNILDMLNKEGQNVLTRIIKRDLKCGFSENSINEAIPNLIPTFNVALAQSYKDHEKKVWDGSVFYGSQKMDGCVHFDTLVETKKHGIMKIGNLIENNIKDEIKCYDIYENKITYNNILNRIKNGIDINQKKVIWYEIELENDKKIKLTGNHMVWLPILKCYRKVEDLTLDDYLMVDN